MNMEAENCGLQKGETMINNNYRSFFGLKKEPFGADISIMRIPTHSVHPFRFIPSTDSDSFRPLIPMHSVH